MSDAKKARQRAKKRNWKRSNMARQKEQIRKAQMSEEGQRTRHREKSVPDIPKPRKGSQKVHKSLPKNPEKVREVSVEKLVHPLSPQKRKAVIQLVTSIQSGARSKVVS